MSSNKNLMRAASVTGAAVAVAAFPMAADAADAIPTNDYGYFLSLEGGALFADPAFDKVGISGSGGSGGFFDLDNFDDELGFRGAAAFGQLFQNGWDWRVGVSVSRFMNNDASSSFSGGGDTVQTSAQSDIDYETADLEIGFRPNHGGSFDLRLFGGLRFLHSEDSLDKTGLHASGGPFADTFANNISSEFMGIGPRGGLDFATRMQDGMFGFSGMAAAAAIFGKRNQDTKFQFLNCSGGGCTGIGPVGVNDDENETIFNVEAALGLDLHLSDASKVTIGYRGEYWKDMNGSADKLGGGGGMGPSIVDGDEDLLAHGPFLRFTSEF